MIRFCALWLALWPLSSLPAQQPIDVIIVSGQSNAVGFDAPPEELPASEWDEQIRFWWRCGDPPPDKHDSNSGRWTTLRPQPLGNPIRPRQSGDRQYGNFAQRAGGFGPEIGLARAIASRGGRPLAIIKVAFSGTHLAGDWNPGLAAKTGPAVNTTLEPDANEPETMASVGDSRGACYRSLLAETNRAMTELRKTGKPRLVGFVWIQGESDATADRAPQYRTNLSQMITALRRDLAAPELIALLGVNTKFQAGKNKNLDIVIEAQKAYADTDPRARYVDTDGASIANNVHFDAAGTLDVGRRFADAFHELTSP